jgi:hypothetical protein
MHLFHLTLAHGYRKINIEHGETPYLEDYNLN